jgi:hypothetical protein
VAGSVKRDETREREHLFATVLQEIEPSRFYRIKVNFGGKKVMGLHPRSETGEDGE